jgi:short-chain 2-methylacyl-CoA dehydrogenase
MNASFMHIEDVIWSRAFSVSVPAHSDLPTSLDVWTEDELMLRDSGTWVSAHLLCSSSNLKTVARFATDVVGPKVRDMDEAEQMDPEILRGLFEQGVRHNLFSGSKSTHIVY